MAPARVRARIARSSWWSVARSRIARAARRRDARQPARAVVLVQLVGAVVVQHDEVEISVAIKVAPCGASELNTTHAYAQA